VRGTGEGEIRTPETFDSLLAFQASAFDHSATSPGADPPFAPPSRHSGTPAERAAGKQDNFPSFTVALDRYIQNVRTLEFAGDIDVARYPEVHERFTSAIEDPQPVLVDLTTVDRADSTFLSELLVFVRRRETGGRAVAVLLGTPNLGRIFAITNLEYRMRVYYERSVAERELARGAG
jgi:anti-anti-sigma factor